MKTLTIISILLLAIIICGCSPPQTEDQTPTGMETITLDSETSIPKEACQARGLENKIIMLESDYCGHCKTAEPILKEIEKEKQMSFEFLDVSSKQGQEFMKNKKINIKYTPTLIAGCTVYIGSKSKQEYAQIIDKFAQKE